MQNFLWHIDYPPPDSDDWDLEKPVSGWVSSAAPLERAELRAGPRADGGVKLADRPDVRKANSPAFPCHSGFESALPLAEFLSGREASELELRFHFGGGGVETVSLPLRYVPPGERKRRKLEKIAPLLACPACLGALEKAPDLFRCPACRAAYPHNGNSVDFLTPEFKAGFAVTATANVSGWNYDPRIFKLITENPDKLFLDCGAGFRRRTYDNVVNYEIADYPSTDILGVAEKLPFAHDSFDGVFSIAVLEHVKDPFRCAAEIRRVLKPGGVLCCSAAFLSPVHAYPNHYYNMTLQGLENLFEGMEITERAVPFALHPLRALAWQLREYAEALPPRLRWKFLRLATADILAMDRPELFKNNPFSAELPEQKRFELACGTLIMARKPG